MSHSAPVQHSRASNAQVQVAQVAQGQNCSRIDVIFAVVFAVPLMWFNCLLKFVLKLSPYSHLCPAFTPQAFPRASTQINSYLRGSGCVDESFKLGRLWTTTRTCTRTRTQTSPMDIHAGIHTAVHHAGDGEERSASGTYCQWQSNDWADGY